MHALHQLIEFFRWHQAGVVHAVCCICTNVDDADAVMRIQHRHGVVGPLSNPVQQGTAASKLQCMQHKGRQSKVIHPVDLLGNFHLALVIRVDFHQHFQAQFSATLGESFDEFKGLGHHEAVRTRLLDGITHRIQAHHGDATLREFLQNRFQIGLPCWRLDINVNLLWRERRPQQAPLAVGQCCHCKGHARAWSVHRQQILFGRAIRENSLHRQEQPVVFRCTALLRIVQELWRF